MKFFFFMIQNLRYQSKRETEEFEREFKASLEETRKRNADLVNTCPQTKQVNYNVLKNI